MHHSFDFAGAALVARADGTLWWPERRLLALADLHLGRSERLARRGGALLPPYEVRATLERLEAALAACDPAEVVLVGDVFDDGAAAGPCAPALAPLLATRRWHLVAGNHDPGALVELRRGPLVFRHIAERGAAGEVSGHHHPKLGLSAGGRRMVRPCFLLGRARIILPAFGAYTGGVDARRLAGLVEDCQAVLTGRRTRVVPLSTKCPEKASQGKEAFTSGD